MKPGRTRQSYLTPEPKQPVGHPHYPRYVSVQDAEGNTLKHLVQNEDEHKARFPEDHGDLLAEHGTLHWEPPTEAPKAAPVPQEPKPLSADFPRWHEHIHEDGTKEKRLIQTEEEFKARYPEAHAELHSA